MHRSDTFLCWSIWQIITQKCVCFFSASHSTYSRFTLYATWPKWSFSFEYLFCWLKILSSLCFKGIYLYIVAIVYIILSLSKKEIVYIFLPSSRILYIESRQKHIARVHRQLWYMPRYSVKNIHWKNVE